MTFFNVTKDLAATAAGAAPAGDVVLIGYNDNATSLRVRGPNAPAEGSIDVQSYSGIFYNVAYAGTGTLQTRVIHGANVEMDLEIQGPHQVRIAAVDDTQTDGQVWMASKTNIVINTRADAEVASPRQLIIDRASTGTTGVANTSNVEVSVSAGELEMASPTLFTNMLGLPTYLVGGLPPVLAGGLIFVSDAAAGAGRIAYGNTAAAAWIDPETGIAVA